MFLLLSKQLDSQGLLLWFRQVAGGSWDSLGQQTLFPHMLLLTDLDLSVSLCVCRFSQHSSNFCPLLQQFKMYFITYFKT